MARDYLTQPNLERLKDEIKEGLESDYNLSTFESLSFSELLDKNRDDLFNVLVTVKHLLPSEYYALQYHASPEELLLRIFDVITDNHGLEFQLIDSENEDAPQGLEFSNSGDTYNATLIYVVTNVCNAGGVGYLEYTCIGDIIEHWHL